jgi:integrase/recombinase XerD
VFKPQLVRTGAGRESWTVTGPAFLPVPHAEDFLSYCSAVGCERLPQTLSREEVQALLDASRHLRDRFLIALLYETGLRIGQALGLRHGDVRTWELRLLVRPRDDNANRARAKTRKEHLIEITPELGELHSHYMFDEYGDVDSDYVFVNLWGGRRGHALTYSNVVGTFRALEVRTGIKARPHMLRHTHATELLRFGVRTELVAKRLTMPARQRSRCTNTSTRLT